MNKAFIITREKKMDTPPLQIRIKLDLPFKVVNYFKQLERWENEGGNPDAIFDVSQEIDLPIRPNEQFQVIDGHITFDGNECFYVAEITKLR